ncbi:flagellar basal body-associated FliL family protein [Aliikangiella maris]|uniref:Flagellar protein FliL n=2 Tax=Aliikangiella maris TaxID=3162458 RepID=A0ABV3MS11_9GAMM
MLNKIRLLIILIIASFLLFSAKSFAFESEKPPLKYFQIDPNILTFYQSSGRKFGYIVVQIQIVVRGQENYDRVETHLPLIQDSLIDFFNRQSKETIQDLKQREQLRLDAKQKVDDILKEELGISIVENLLFTQYVFQ